MVLMGFCTGFDEGFYSKQKIYLMDIKSFD